MNLFSKLTSLWRTFEKSLVERREMERELAHLASFAELDPNCVLETDLAGHILYSNITAQNAFHDLASTGTEHPLLAGLESIVRSFHAQEKSLMSRPVKVRDRIYQQQIKLIESGTRLRMYITDVTELNHLDQLKTDFVNIVTHELRTPLAGLQASVRMVQAGMMGPLTPDQSETLNLANSNIERLGRLINNLLDISKIEAGRMELLYEWVDLGQMLIELQKSFAPLARERGLTLRVRKIATPVGLYADKDKLHEVLTNLMQNAMKFTPQGVIELFVEQNKNQIICTVSDTGPGISPAGLSKLFGKFQQIGTRPVTHEKGTGLGLSICKAIVELHHGKIWAESNVGKGTEFRFSLPRYSAEHLFRTLIRPCIIQGRESGNPLCLFSIHISDWDAAVSSLTKEAQHGIMAGLAEAVRTCLRKGTDTILSAPGKLYLAAPGLSVAEGHALLARVTKVVETTALLKTLPQRTEVLPRVANFPLDSENMDVLLAKIGCVPHIKSVPRTPSPVHVI